MLKVGPQIGPETSSIDVEPIKRGPPKGTQLPMALEKSKSPAGIRRS